MALGFPELWDMDARAQAWWAGPGSAPTPPPQESQLLGALRGLKGDGGGGGGAGLMGMLGGMLGGMGGQGGGASGKAGARKDMLLDIILRNIGTV